MSEISQSTAKDNICRLVRFRHASWFELRLKSRPLRIRFTKHAHDKFDFLKRYGFTISEENIEDIILNPARLEHRDRQLLALKPIDHKHAIRVVYEGINDNIVVVTFYS